MRLAAYVAVALTLASPAVARQSLDAYNVFALEGEPRQETTTSPVTLTFHQPVMIDGKRMVQPSRVAIAAADINQAMTVQARSIATGEVGRIFVLNVVRRNVQQTTATPLQLTLASGATITVPPAGVNDYVTIQLRSRLQNTAPTASSATSSGAARSKCAEEWPDDFRMRAYCEEQQNTSAQALAARSMTSADERTIRAKCEREWPGDFRMRNYCEEQQLKALHSIR